MSNGEVMDVVARGALRDTPVRIPTLSEWNSANSRDLVIQARIASPGAHRLYLQQDSSRRKSDHKWTVQDATLPCTTRTLPESQIYPRRGFHSFLRSDGGLACSSYDPELPLLYAQSGRAAAVQLSKIGGLVETLMDGRMLDVP